MIEEDGGQSESGEPVGKSGRRIRASHDALLLGWVFELGAEKEK
jgi:hypothetical protein